MLWKWLSCIQHLIYAMNLPLGLIKGNSPQNTCEHHCMQTNSRNLLTQSFWHWTITDEQLHAGSETSKSIGTKKAKAEYDQKHATHKACKVGKIECVGPFTIMKCLGRSLYSLQSIQLKPSPNHTLYITHPIILLHIQAQIRPIDKSVSARL